MTRVTCVLIFASAALLTTAAQLSPAQTAGSGQVKVQSASPGAPRHRARRRTRGAIQTIPAEQQQSPAGSSTPNVTPAQRAADAQLLRQQEARSAREAQINNQQVQKVEQQQNAQAAQQRIQSTPGPSQSVLVPGYPPVVGTSATPARIDEAPGPMPVPVPVTVPQQPATPPQP